MKYFMLIILFVLFFNNLEFAQDTTQQVQYRRGIELQAGYQSYEEKYFGKNLLDEKRSKFPLQSTGVWTELNPKVPRVDYIGVHFVNKDTGWACGDLGAIIKTTDGGQNWTVSETNTTALILKIFSLDDQLVIATGYDGLILRSSDGGENFQQVTSGVGTGIDLWGVQMLNDTLGWVCGNYHTLLKTTDAGLSWSPVNAGLNQHYWSLDFLNDNYGMIVCGNGFVLKTSDGGNNWQQKQAGNNDPLFSINIIDSLHIAAVGANGKSVYSSDAGESWIENPSFTGWDLNCVYFVNSDTGYTIGENLNLRRTTNRGFTWESENLNVGEWEIQLQNEENFGVAAGNVLKLYKTENGFENWNQLILNEDFNEVYFIRLDIGFALGSRLYKTQDGGLTFDKQINGSGGNCILFVDSLVGYIGSSRCYIYKTMDSGNSWYRTNRNGLNDTIGTINKIFFISDNIGWAITSRGGILKTTDSGENWYTQLNAGIFVNYLSIYFIDTLIGWTANTGARPFKTTDGGNNWLQQTNLDIWSSRDLHFFNTSRGLIIDGLFDLLQTTNSGNIWFNQLNSQYVIRSFGWLNNQHGFIIGDGIYETTDSGETWQEILELRNIGLRKFNAPKNYIGYSTGNLGLIYKYIDTTIVPVELISFGGESINNKVLLSWQTASEINNNGFEIERSLSKNKSNQEDWLKIGFVNGYGTTTEPHFYTFTDESLTPRKYQYRLKQIDYDGSFEYSNTIEIEVGIPVKFSLEQNYPNPFNPSTTIRYQIPQDGIVTLKIYDILGSEVATLINEEKVAGKYEVNFNASSLASGVYIYKIQAGDFISAKKMMLLK